jgi:hypothetical protein
MSFYVIFLLGLVSINKTQILAIYLVNIMWIHAKEAQLLGYWSAKPSSPSHDQSVSLMINLTQLISIFHFLVK